ncbi:MAG: agmatine deiminase family protein [Nitrososphaerales archaeon]
MQTDKLDLTPRKLGYVMPAEWEKHDATWLAWPHDPSTFPNRVSKVENIYVKIIKALHEGENVNLFVRDEHMKERVTTLLEENNIDLERLNFLVFDYADVWIRDYGPIFLVNKSNGEQAIVRWIFNAWGEKYAELMKDARIPSIIGKKLQLNTFNPSIVLEGGSVDVNGIGTLITTERCLLNKNRNPHLSKKEIGKYLKEYLGVNHVIWLRGGIVGDDTDGHVDDIARFINSRTVLCAYEEDENDPNYSHLKENHDILLDSKDQDGNLLEVIKLPMPGYVGSTNVRLPASYANFYIGNKVVLVPIFGHDNEQEALNIIQKCFPDRSIVGINCSDLVYGMGAIHCITQQQPANVLEVGNQ